MKSTKGGTISEASDIVWRPRTSVKVRLAVIQGVFMALVISVLALALYLPVRGRLVSVTDESYRLLADNVSSSLYPSFVSDNREGVAAGVRRVRGLNGVKYVLILDSAGTVYYDSTSGETSLTGTKYVDSLSTPGNLGELQVGKVTRDGVQYYNYSAPFVSQNKVLYTVRLGVAEEAIDGEFNRLARLFVSLGSAAVLAGILLSYLLAARITRPITKLTESALAIRAGNLNAYADITTNDELEQLSREFQGMVEKLKNFYFLEYSQKEEAVSAKKHFQEANKRLEELDRQKSDFMNTASHQLRTPLTVINWSLSLIDEHVADLHFTPEQRTLLEESLKSTKRMIDLVNDLLNISRIEQGRIETVWAKGNVGDVCQQLVNSLQALAVQKSLRLTFEKVNEIPDSFFDEKALYQVINNFVDNAIKYTTEGFVAVTCAVQGDHLNIIVMDSGIGMTEEERAKLFTRFARGTEASKLFTNGSGLGMYVALALLKQQGGSVAVDSEHNKGTTFTVSLPLYSEPPKKVSAVSQGGLGEAPTPTPATAAPKARSVHSHPSVD